MRGFENPVVSDLGNAYRNYLSLLTFPIYFLSPILFAQTKLFNWMEEQQELLIKLVQ
jgi:hypothetical protein